RRLPPRLLQAYLERIPHAGSRYATPRLANCKTGNISGHRLARCVVCAAAQIIRDDRSLKEGNSACTARGGHGYDHGTQMACRTCGRRGSILASASLTFGQAAHVQWDIVSVVPSHVHKEVLNVSADCPSHR